MGGSEGRSQFFLGISSYTGKLSAPIPNPSPDGRKIAAVRQCAPLILTGPMGKKKIPTWKLSVVLS
jgi:hypothetical protein